MEYSNSFKSAISAMFTPSLFNNSSPYRTRRGELACIRDNTIFNSFRVIDTKNPVIEFPAYWTPNYVTASKYIVPIFCSFDEGKVVSGMDSALKYFSRYNGRLVKVRTNKGDIYYGNKGLILNSQFEPIIEFGGYYTMPENSVEKIPVSTGEAYLKVSQSIFLNQDITVNKAIIKKIIPYCLALPNLRFWDYNNHEYRNFSIKVVFTDKFTNFVKPKLSISSIDNSAINNLLLDNMEVVLSQYKNEY